MTEPVGRTGAGLCGAPGPAPGLTITCLSVGTSWTLALCGSLDATSAIALHSQFEQLSPGEFEHVIVDISELMAIDLTGATALSSLGERVALVGAELRLRHRGRTVSGASPRSGGGLSAPNTPLDPA